MPSTLLLLTIVETKVLYKDIDDRSISDRHKMNDIENNKESLAIYWKLLENAKGGIFTNKTRMRLLNLVHGREKTMNDFWYDRRKNIEAALVDIQLFVEVAGKDNVNQVMTWDSLRPIIHQLLYEPAYDLTGPDINKAEIASRLIQAGFVYLSMKKRNHITNSHQRTINDALDLSSYLVELFKPESERRYSGPQPDFKVIE